MFSAESMISMADGSTKHINLIAINDTIYNKLLEPVKVDRLHNIQNYTVSSVLLNNGTGVFYCAPSAMFLAHTSHTNGNHISDYLPISEAYSLGSKLKSNGRIFSPESDITISTYEASTPKTVYYIHTLDIDQTFIVNGVIVKCNI